VNSAALVSKNWLVLKQNIVTGRGLGNIVHLRSVHNVLVAQAQSLGNEGRTFPKTQPISSITLDPEQAKKHDLKRSNSSCLG
jgi:hypothetical protein